MNSRRLSLEEYSSLQDKLIRSGVHQPSVSDVIQEIVSDFKSINHACLIRKLSDTLFIDFDAANYLTSEHVSKLMNSGAISYDVETCRYTAR